MAGCWRRRGGEIPGGVQRPGGAVLGPSGTATCFTLPVTLASSGSSIVSLLKTLIRELAAVVIVDPVEGTNGDSCVPGAPPDNFVECFRAGAVVPPATVPRVTPKEFIHFRGDTRVADNPGTTPGPTRTGRAVPGARLSKFLTVAAPDVTVVAAMVLTTDVLFFSRVLDPGISHGVFSSALSTTTGDYRSTISVILTEVPTGVEPTVDTKGAP